jgi:hypothetical protein
LDQFRLVGRSSPAGDSFDVFVEVPPLTRAQLARVPEWTRTTHERLFGAHLDGLTGHSERQAKIAAITARLDRLQQSSGRGAQRSTGIDRSLGR